MQSNVFCINFLHNLSFPILTNFIFKVKYLFIICKIYEISVMYFVYYVENVLFLK